MKQLTEELKRLLFPERTVLVGYRGSVAHEMYVPNTDPNSIDDVDLMGVYMAPKEFYIGLGRGYKKYNKGRERFVGKYDVVNYEFRRFVNLLIKSNPNVMSMLWLKDNHYIQRSTYGKLLIENRDLFSSKKAYQSFIGYASGQLHKMEHYSTEGYMGEKRKALVDKFGYDTKNAAHCIRLLRMGMEFLLTGELFVARSDAKRLLEIKLGKWTLENVKDEAERLFELTDQAYVKSPLPAEPDIEKIEKLVMSVILNYISNNHN